MGQCQEVYRGTHWNLKRLLTEIFMNSFKFCRLFEWSPDIFELFAQAGASDHAKSLGPKGLDGHRDRRPAQGRIGAVPQHPDQAHGRRVPRIRAILCRPWRPDIQVGRG